MRRRRGRGEKQGRILWTGARAGLALVAAVILLAGAAFTAANLVPQTNVDDQRLDVLPTAVTPPPECEGITFDVTGSGSGVIAGSLGNDWIVGSDQVDTISGLDGNDCIEGKAADDIIDGGPGRDVCLGGDGNDTFMGCETEVQ